MSDETKPMFVVLRRQNGHLTPIIGEVVEIFESEEAASVKAEDMAVQFQGTTFVYAHVLGQRTVKPQMIKEP